MTDKQEFYPPPPSYDVATGTGYQSGPYPQQQVYPQPQVYPQAPTYPQAPAYPQAPSYPQPQPAHQIIITTTPIRNYVAPAPLGQNPAHVTCSNCRNQILTSVTSESMEPEYCTPSNHAACFILFMAGFLTAGIAWFCSCLPYAFCSGPATNIYRHRCPRCGVMLGTYVRQNQ